MTRNTGSAAILCTALILITTSPVAGQGNQRDLSLAGSVAHLDATNFARTAKVADPGGIEIRSRQGTSLGLPFALFAELRGPSAQAPVLLPGEPEALVISLDAIAIIDGFADSFLPPLGPGGLSLTYFVPSVPGLRIIAQAVTLDPTAPNGLAISDWTGVDVFSDPIFTSMPGPLSANANHGAAIEFADLDGDGKDELLSAARSERVNNIAEVGRVRVYRSGMTTPWFTLDDPETGLAAARNLFGYAIAVGDVTGDGHVDIAVGARGADLAGGLAEAGKVVLFYGPAFIAHRTLVPGQPEVQGRFGHFITIADFDGDGIGDLAISSPRADAPNGILDAGAVEIFYGPITTPGLASFRLEAVAPQPSAAFGYQTAAADIDGDGRAELVCASPSASNLPSGTDRSGRLDVFWGGAVPTLLRSFPNPAPTDMSQLGADVVFKDATGDGIPDLVAGAELDDGSFEAQGSVFIVEGPTFQTWRQVWSPAPSLEAGFGGSVDVGEFHGDGHRDLLVSEFWWTGTRLRQGRVLVLRGPTFTVAETYLEPTPGLRHSFGRRVRAGDFNADGVDELLIGVPAATVSGVLTAGILYHIRP